MPKTAEILEIPAAITERGQTTVPAAIRRMLVARQAQPRALSRSGRRNGRHRQEG